MPSIQKEANDLYLDILGFDLGVFSDDQIFRLLEMNVDLFSIEDLEWLRKVRRNIPLSASRRY